MPYFYPFFIIKTTVVPIRKLRMKTRVESPMDNCYSFPAYYHRDIVMASFGEAFRGDLSCTLTG